MLPSTLKYLCSVEPVRMHFPTKQPYCANDTVCNAAMQHCTQYHLYTAVLRENAFNGTELLQGRWQHGEKVGYCYPSGLEKTLCKRNIYVLLVTKGLNITEHATVCTATCRLLIMDGWVNSSKWHCSTFTSRFLQFSPSNQHSTTAPQLTVAHLLRCSTVLTMQCIISLVQLPQASFLSWHLADDSVRNTSILVTLHMIVLHCQLQIAYKVIFSVVSYIPIADSLKI